MFFKSILSDCRWRVISVAVTGTMAPWITEWSNTSMESKVFLNIFYLGFLFLYLW